MARYKCPSCGGSFNGKKCTNCLYETFNEEFSHGLHTHRGEPLVIAAPARRPIPRRDPFGCEERTRKPGKKAPKWLIWLLVFLLLEPMLILGGVVFEAVGDAISTGTREPEPDAVLPEGTELLLKGEGLQLFLGPSEDGRRYPLYLENTTKQNVVLSSRAILVDGFLSEQSSAWCDAPAGTLRQGELWLDGEDLAWAAVEEPSRIEADLLIFETEDYEDLLEANVILKNGTPPPPVVPEGRVLLEGEDVFLSFLGFPEEGSADFEMGILPFYLENRREEAMSVYAEEIRINGQSEELGFWYELPGGSRTVSRLWLFLGEDLDIGSLDQVQSLQLHLVASSEVLGWLDLGWVTID